MERVAAVVVERNSPSHPFGVCIIEGDFAEQTFCLDSEPQENIGEVVTVEFYPEDQFAEIVQA